MAASGGSVSPQGGLALRQLSAAHVPALLDLNTAWRELFMAPAADGESAAAPEADGLAPPGRVLWGTPEPQQNDEDQ